ncbi:MAG: hypothetical protein JRF65_16090, partial [Deltaproteobacteria bacterium]|nr:hypothetical protein [Deltaproteobacteria bacterium]
PAHAQNFYNAAYYGTVANEYANISTGQGVVAFLFQDSTALYDFYAYAEAAQQWTGAAYAAAEAGYSANPTEANYWALLYALYDWYYKYIVAEAAYTAYMSSDYDGIVDAMVDTLTGDVINAG